MKRKDKITKHALWSFVGLWVLLFTACLNYSADEPGDHVRVGDHMPSFTVEVTDADGLRSTFSTDHLEGETVVVFFNTSCADCQRELPRLERYYQHHRQDEGFRMVAISREEGEERVAAYWHDNGLTIPYAAQQNRRIYSLFAQSVIPRVYISTRSGMVSRIYVERLDESFPD